MYIHKVIAIFLILMLSPMRAIAQTGVNTMVVEHLSGSKTEISLTDGMIAFFTKGELIIRSLNNSSSFTLNEIQAVAYSNKSAVSSIHEACSQKIAFAFFENGIILSGTSLQDTVQIFNSQGVELMSVSCEVGETHVDLSQLSKGVYIIIAGNQSIKFVK